MGQQFTRITTGDLVSTSSDSRSCNFVDINNDGWDDLFISNGPTNGQNNMLYINNGDGTFVTVTNDPIVKDMGKSDGTSFADIDNDGDLDAFVVTWYGQENFFYRNQGNGTFIHESENLLGKIGTFSETASWGDFDQDGLVDLYLTNSDGNKQNLLYRNKGNGQFERIEHPALTKTENTARSIHWIDFDNNGKTDLFITNEKGYNEFYHNQGNGIFNSLEVLDKPWNSTGSSWADIDNDGDLDLFVANAGYYAEQHNQLFLNDGKGNFKEVINSPLTTQGGCSYGSAFGDVDNDGDLDLLVANGYCLSNLQDFLYLNDGKGNFTRDTTYLPDLPQACSFGVAWGDYNNDGFIDLAIAQCQNRKNQDPPANTLYKNNGNANNWLKIKLEGTASNRVGIDAKIRVLAEVKGEKIWQLRTVSGQSGYCGQNSVVAHFGLGDTKKVEEIVVEWPSGKRSIRKKVSSNQLLHIKE